MPETWLLQIANLCDAKWPLSANDMEFDFKSISYHAEKMFKLTKELGHAPFRAEQPNGFPDTDNALNAPRHSAPPDQRIGKTRTLIDIPFKFQ